MQIIETDLRDLVAEHNHYLARLKPVIRNRLTRRGVEEATIDAYVADLPTEHIVTRIGRAMAGIRDRRGVDL